ncbi:hypothetical protein AB0I81_48645 [Nonomuraea sp. NPDC050404]|uniref:hypothetical protein n=1 Tax=Nonomuraea sp. NPDC050404 TaxID=3155783 RepID=UPI00340145DE
MVDVGSAVQVGGGQWMVLSDATQVVGPSLRVAGQARGLAPGQLGRYGAQDAVVHGAQDAVVHGGQDRGRFAVGEPSAREEPM